MNLTYEIKIQGNEIELVSKSNTILKSIPLSIRILSNNKSVKNIKIRTDIGDFYTLKESENGYCIKLRQNMFKNLNTKIYIIAEIEGYGDTLYDLISDEISLELSSKNLYEAKDNLEIISEIISSITRRSVYGDKN